MLSLLHYLSREVMQQLGYYSRSFPVWMQRATLNTMRKNQRGWQAHKHCRISCMFLKLGIKVSENKMMHHLKCIKTALVYRFEITLFDSILVVRNHPIWSIQICKNGKMHVQVLYIYTQISNQIILSMYTHYIFMHVHLPRFIPPSPKPP